MAETKLEQARGALAALEERAERVIEDIENPDLDFEDIKSLDGEGQAEKDASWSALRMEIVEARDKVQLYESAEAMRASLSGRREVDIPPVEEPKSVLDETGQLRARRTPSEAYWSWQREPEVKDWLARIAVGDNRARLEHPTQLIELGPNWSQGWLPDGNWIAGNPAQWTTLTPQATRSPAGQSPNRGEVEGTRPVIMQTQLPDVYTSILDLITTMQVETIDSQWWVERQRDEPTATQMAVGENASAHKINITGELHDVRIQRYPIAADVSRRAMSNGVALQRIVMERLPQVQREMLDSEVANGPGTGNRFRGFLNWNDYSTEVPDLRNINWDLADTTTTSTSLDSGGVEARQFPMRVREAITEVMRYGGVGASANAILVHFDIYDEVLNAATTTGESTLTVTWGMGVPPTIRGLPVIPTAHLGVNVNTAIAVVADWRSMLLLNNVAAREGTGVIVSTENASNFEQGLVTFLLEGEYAFIVENPNAVCTITRT